MTKEKNINIKNLFDPHYQCEPYEAIGSVANDIHPETFVGVQLDFNKQYTPHMLSGHYFRILPAIPEMEQQVGLINSFLLSGSRGNLIVRLDQDMKGSLMGSFNALNNQLSSSVRYSKNE